MHYFYEQNSNIKRTITTYFITMFEQTTQIHFIYISSICHDIYINTYRSEYDDTWLQNAVYAKWPLVIGKPGILNFPLVAILSLYFIIILLIYID